MKNQRGLVTIVYLVIMAVLMSWVLGIFNPGTSDIPYSEVVELFREEQVRSFTVADQTITLELYNPLTGRPW